MGRHNPRSSSNKVTVPKSHLRIIGGQWRGRKLEFMAVDGLRPTPDRVRETLFNWLQPYLPGARCLDLFSGSGALGLEALSRGAESATFVDLQALTTRQLQNNLHLLKAQTAEVVQADVLQWLESRQTDMEARYDMVFMDPPFRKDLVAPCSQLLESRNILADNAIIYVETESELTDPDVPENWKEHRSKTAGQVNYRLYMREA
ncbi:MAG: 16S rRNA (guanine(966)-N(2))-methyltransferase RsmD [Neptuniibacter sp.]